MTSILLTDLASGATVEAVSNAVYCLGTGKAIHPSVWSALVVFFGPFLIALTFAVFYFAIAMGGVMNKKVAAKQFVLSFFAILYFNYSNITRQSLSVFLCIGVPDNDFADADSMRYVWAQDTSLECKTGQHQTLTVLTALFIGLVAFGFPIACSFTHYSYNQLKNLEPSGSLYDVLGFMFRAYDSQYRYWESLIMLRKACLSVAAVFSYRLGGTTQSLLATTILIICLYFHTTCRPFREEFNGLNKYESYSLIVSCMTYLLAGFFTDGRAAEWVKVGLSIFLIVLIVGFPLMVLRLLFESVIWYFEAELSAADIDVCDFCSLRIALTWVTFRMGYTGRDTDNENSVTVEMTSVT